jgi:hypothetical protein
MPPARLNSLSDDFRTNSGESMKLLDAGQSPRRTLRYEWRLDQKEQLSMELRTAVSTENMGGPQAEVPLPAVRIVIAVDPQNITPDRDLRYVWRVTSATVDAADETPAQIAEGIRAEVAEIARLSGGALVTNRGLAKEVTIDTRGGGKPSGTGQMAETIRQTLRDIAAPLPDEPVGIGARWRKLSQSDDNDTLVTQAETFRLAELQGDRGALDDSLAQTAPPQVLPAPALQGTRTRMESMLASGQARVRFDLSRLVPQTSFDGTTQMVVSGPVGEDAARNLKTVMHVSYAFSGSRR